MIRVFGEINVGGQNTLICDNTGFAALTDSHPVVDDYKDDKGNVIATGLPCGEPTFALNAEANFTVKTLINGSWK